MSLLLWVTQQLKWLPYTVVDLNEFSAMLRNVPPESSLVHSASAQVVEITHKTRLNLNSVFPMLMLNVPGIQSSPPAGLPPGHARSLSVWTPLSEQSRCLKDKTKQDFTFITSALLNCMVHRKICCYGTSLIRKETWS